MAEAAVDDSATNRFFCHKCSIEITRVLEDYTCPTCRGGFIEELDSTNTSSDDPSDDHSDDEVGELLSDAQNQFGEFLFGRGGIGGIHDPRTAEEDQVDRDGRRYRNATTSFSHNLRPSVLALIISLISSNRARQNYNVIGNSFGQPEVNLIPTIQTIEDFYSLLGMEQFRDGNVFGRYSNSFEHTIQDFIINVTGFGWGPTGPGGRGNEPVFFLGNPGDYAWGREGLDTIVTQLLNQMDVRGPPPLDKEKIKKIPVTVIEKEQVESNLQCSVCWDDFKVGETVRKLECEHFYHESCIVPWLELHGTCPICRKNLFSDEEEKSPANPGSNNSNRSNLAAVIQVVRSRASSNRRSGSSSTSSASAPAAAPLTTTPTTTTTTTTATSTSTSTSTSSTSNSNSSDPGRRRPPPPSSDFQMDLEYD